MRTREEAIRTFNPVPDAAESWATLAKEAGMKYMAFTTKHTSGFDFPDCPYRQ